MNRTIEYEVCIIQTNNLPEAYLKAFQLVLESGWYILGNKVKTFEEEIRPFL